MIMRNGFYCPPFCLWKVQRIKSRIKTQPKWGSFSVVQKNTCILASEVWTFACVSRNISLPVLVQSYSNCRAHHWDRCRWSHAGRTLEEWPSTIGHLLPWNSYISIDREKVKPWIWGTERWYQSEGCCCLWRSVSEEYEKNTQTNT